MKAMEAIFEKGEVIFPFNPPDSYGPIGILIIFPDEPVDALDWGFEEDIEAELGVPG